MWLATTSEDNSKSPKPPQPATHAEGDSHSAQPTNMPPPSFLTFSFVLESLNESPAANSRSLPTGMKMYDAK
jgi:hypothetical protein